MNGDRIRLASIAIITGVLYVPLLVDKNQNPDFGSFAYFTVLAGTLVLTRVLFRQASASPPWPIALGVPALLLFVHDNPLFHISRDRTAPQAEMSLERLSDSILEGDGNRVVFVFDTLLLPYPNLTYVHYKRHRRFLQVDRVDAFAELPGILKTADFIVAIDEPNATGLIRMKAWTNNRRIPAVLDLLDTAPGWERRTAVPFRDFNIRLYARANSQDQ